MTEKKVNQRVMLSKRLIKESLTELLKTKGIHSLSVRLLCETAGINRTTFYKYYGSQYDVLAEMEEELLENIRTTLERGTAASDREQIEAICAYLEQHIDSIRVLVGNNVDPDFPKKLFYLPQIRQMILERLGDRYDKEAQNYVYIFIVNGAYHLVREWVDRDSRRSFTEVAFLLEDMIDRICCRQTEN